MQKDNIFIIDTTKCYSNKELQKIIDICRKKMDENHWDVVKENLKRYILSQNECVQNELFTILNNIKIIKHQEKTSDNDMITIFHITHNDHLYKIKSVENNGCGWQVFVNTNEITMYSSYTDSEPIKNFNCFYNKLQMKNTTKDILYEFIMKLFQEDFCDKSDVQCYINIFLEKNHESNNNSEHNKNIEDYDDGSNNDEDDSDDSDDSCDIYDSE